MARIEFMSSVKCRKPPAFAWHVNLQRWPNPLRSNDEGTKCHIIDGCIAQQSLPQLSLKKTDGLFRTWAFVCGPETSTSDICKCLVKEAKKNTLGHETWSTFSALSPWGNQYIGLAIQQLCSSRIGCQRVPPVVSPCTSSTDPPPWHAQAQVQEVQIRLLMLFNTKHLALHQSGWTGIFTKLKIRSFWEHSLTKLPCLPWQHRRM